MRHRSRLWLLSISGAALATLLGAACLDLPRFGGASHPYGERATAAAFSRHTANVISSVNFDLRAFDTLGEESILFAAVLGTGVLLRRVKDERQKAPTPAPAPGPLRLYVLAVLPVSLLIGLYVIAHGQLSPGGGFQGGVVAASSVHLLYIGVDYRALERVRPLAPYVVADAAAEGAYVLIGAGALLGGGSYLANDFLPYGTFNTITSGGTVPLLNAAVGVEVACSVIVLLAHFLDQAVEIEAARLADREQRT